MSILGQSTVFAAAIGTWLGADDRIQSIEYFCERYSHREDDDTTFKVRNAIVTALEAWGPHKLSDFKVALVSTDEEVRCYNFQDA